MNPLSSTPPVQIDPRLQLWWRREGSLVAAVASVLCVLFTLWAGKDVNFDLINYHLYAGHLALHDRLHQDFMAASTQSYFNPYGYVPFYVLVTHFPDWVAGIVMAVLHAGALLAIWHIARKLFPEQTATGMQQRLAAVLLAALTPVWLVEVGTSFLDNVIALPTLAGIALLLGAPTKRGILISGVLFGAGLGLKPTALIMGPFLVLALVWWHRGRVTARLGAGLAWSLATIGGGLLTGGIWLYTIWRLFGNPTFPLFNGYFRSPDFLPENLTQLRFLPRDLADLVLLPVRIAAPFRMVYAEVPLPDLRPLALAIVVVAAAAIGALGWARQKQQRRSSASTGMRLEQTIALWQLSVVVGGSALIWALTSANARYALPQLMLVGVLLVAGIVRLATALGVARAWIVPTASIALLQAIFGVGQSTLRFSPWAWTGGDWVVMRADPLLRARPHLFIGLDSRAGAAIMDVVHRDSAMINAAGQWTLTVDGPGGSRLQALRARFPDSTMLLTAVQLYDEAGVGLPPTPEQIDWRAANVGLELVPGAPCATITLQEPSGVTVRVDAATGERRVVGRAPRSDLIACPARAVSDLPARLAQIRRFDPVFEALERACPGQLGPRGVATTFDGAVHQRAYTNSDVIVSIHAGHVLYQPLTRITAMLGTPEGILSRGVSRCPTHD